jgi:hypothetical protein
MTLKEDFKVIEIDAAEIYGKEKADEMRELRRLRDLSKT